jgi:hypothetical protein
MNVQFSILLTRLHSFIRKYYFDRILKGLLFWLIGVGSVYIVVVVSEYFGYFTTAVRTVLYFGFILFSFSVFIYFVLLPLFGLFKIGKYLSIEEAALILGKHFKSDIDDKILNTIQLKNLLVKDSPQNDLLLASVDQKSSKLITYSFSSAVDLRKNVKYIPYALILLSVIMSGWILFPLVFKESTTRLVQYNTTFSRPAPFSINFENDIPLRALRNESFKITVLVDGDVLPNDLLIMFDGKEVPMLKIGPDRFEYTFRSVSTELDLYINGSGFIFGPYHIELDQKALIKNFLVEARFPDYTNLENKSFDNIGDFSVPEGTKLKWIVYTEDTDRLIYGMDTMSVDFIPVQQGIYTNEITVDKDFSYRIEAINNSTLRGDSLNYSIRVIPDIYPSITMEESRDSVFDTHIFFKGVITDDYGFTNLNFQYRIFETRKFDIYDQVIFSKVQLDFDNNEIRQEFFHVINLLELNLKPGFSIEYFFEVADNDFINGPKISKSPLFSVYIPDYEELIAESISSDEDIKSALSQTIDETNSIQDEIDKLRKSMLESENVSWEQQQTLKDLLEKQVETLESFEKIKELNSDKNLQQQQFNEQEKKIIDKQQELEKLFDEVLSDEMKTLYEQIQEELEKLNKESAFDMLDKMEFEMQNYEEKLDRVLELFKQLQVERMLNESISNLERIKEQQEELHDEMLSEGLEDEMNSEQQNINEKFDSLSELLSEMMKKNEELKRPNSLEDTKQLENDITDDLQDAFDEMNNKSPGKVGESQKGASGKMDKLKSKLMEMQSKMEDENLAEDVRTLREILDNLIKTSFNQETLMDAVISTSLNDPGFIGLIQNQKKIGDDLNLIKDSLTSLAQRQVQIKSIVTREIAEINLNLGQAIDNLIERRKHLGVSRQQFVMTHVNNLALLLNESLQNMQMQMQGQGEGGDPQAGQGAEGFQDLRQMQEQMNKMLEQLREGHQPMPGEAGKPGSGVGMSEQLARMAAEQEAIRKRLGELKNELLSEDGLGNELDELMREMERTELDIVTKNINPQTILRQQRIVTRLLEHENALMEREQEERRVGETAKFFDFSNPKEFFEYNRNKNRAVDMLKSVPPGFKPHYKSMVELYFLNVQE